MDLKVVKLGRWGCQLETDWCYIGFGRLESHVMRCRSLSCPVSTPLNSLIRSEEKPSTISEISKIKSNMVQIKPVQQQQKSTHSENKERLESRRKWQIPPFDSSSTLLTKSFTQNNYSAHLRLGNNLQTINSTWTFNTEHRAFVLCADDESLTNILLSPKPFASIC